MTLSQYCHENYNIDIKLVPATADIIGLTIGCRVSSHCTSHGLFKGDITCVAYFLPTCSHALVGPIVINIEKSEKVIENNFTTFRSKFQKWHKSCLVGVSFNKIKKILEKNISNTYWWSNIF